jgi:hypothetical protein
VGIGETETFDCSLDQPTAAYIVLTGIVVVSVIASGYLVAAFGCGRQASRPSWERSAH